MPIEQRVMNAPSKPIGARQGGAPAAATPGADAEETPRKSKKKLIIIGAVAAAAIGAGAYFFFLAPASTEAAEEPAAVPGEVFTVDAMSINLAEGHYLRLGLGLQLTEEAHEIDSAKAKDAAIALFSGKTIAEVSDPVTRDQLKTELTHTLDELYEGEVMGVYLTDYVTQ